MKRDGFSGSEQDAHIQPVQCPFRMRRAASFGCSSDRTALRSAARSSGVMLSTLRSGAAQPLGQLRPSAPPRNITHRDGNRLLLTNQNDQPRASGDAGVEKVTL
jgi:hypothetical protein